MLALLAIASQSAPARAATQVDLELVLAVDVSLSMDPDEQQLQRDGYIQALRDKGIIRAIRSGPYGRIAVTYFEWAGVDIHLHLIPWRLIDGLASAEAFIRELAARPFGRYRRTSISSALDYASRLFEDGNFEGQRRVIDISGDGANNAGPPLELIRARILSRGIVINGLPIVLRPTTEQTLWDIPGLERYYAKCVIGGLGAFMIPITRPSEFATATRQKLLQEISGPTSLPHVVPVQAGPPTLSYGPYDCVAVESTIRR